MTDARITQQSVQLIANLDPDVRVTQQAVEVVAQGDPNASVTQQVVEVVSRQDPAARISQQALMIVNKSRPSRGPSRQVPITISMTSEKGIPGDPYWSRVEFLMRSDMGYFDLSRRKRKFSMDRRYGPFITSAQAKFGTTSFHQRTISSGTVRHFGLACEPDVQGFGIGRKKFTIEGWIRVAAANAAVVLSCYDTDLNDRGWALHLQAGVPTFWGADLTNSAATVNLSAPSALSLNTWHHLAVDRDAEGVIRLYVNGVMVASTSYSGVIRKAGARMKMGSSHTANGPECWLDDVRFTNGVCRYGSDTGFTPPTSHLPFEHRSLPAVDPTQDKYYDLVSVYLNTSAGIVDLGPKGVPVYGDPAPVASTAQSQSFYDGPAQTLWQLSGSKIVVPDVDGQNNLGDGSAFTIECIFNYYATQGVVSYDIFKVEGQWMLWASAGNMRIYFWNGTSWTSVGNAGDNSYNSVIHFAFTYDGKGTSRMYMNGYLVDKTVGVYPLDVPEAVLQLGWQSSPGRINEFRVTKGVARWTDDYCIPAHEYFYPPAVDGPEYVPEPPDEEDFFYPYPLPVVNGDARQPIGTEWLQLSGNVPGRWDKFVQTGGRDSPPPNFNFFHLNTTARVHTVQTISIPEQFSEDVDAEMVDVVFDLDFALDPMTPAASGCFLIRARDQLGLVTAQRYSRNFSAEAWSRQQLRMPLPSGTTAVDIGFMVNNSGTTPPSNFVNLEVSLEERSEPALYATMPSHPVVAGEWVANLGGAITTVSGNYALTGLAQTANTSDTYFETTLPATAYDDIDAGLCAFEMNWFGTFLTTDVNDGGRVWVEFYDDDAQVGVRRYDAVANYLQTLGGEGSRLEVKIPAGARKARMGYRGVRSATETGTVDFYPLGIHGRVTKPDVLPADPPVAPVVTADEFWPSVRYLLSSRNGAVENLSIFGSLTHTVNGTVQHTASDSKFGDAHNIEINPTGAAASTHYVTVSLPGAAFGLQMTWEAWVYKKGNPRANTSIHNQIGGGNDTASVPLGGGTGVMPDAPIPYDEWFHIAFCREADGQARMYINGKRQKAESTFTTLWAAAFEVGRGGTSTSYASWYGYLDELRVTDGVCRYTDDFVPQSNRFPTVGGPNHLLPVLYTGLAVSGTNTASYSHTNQPIGPASADRRVIVAVVNNRNTGIAGSPNTVTVGGISATKIADFDSEFIGGLHNVSITFWVAEVPTGTTATVAVAYTGNRYRHAIALWWVNGAIELIDTVQGTDATPSVGTIDVGEGGRVIAVALNSQNVGNFIVLGEKIIDEDGTLDITNDYQSWTGVSPKAATNVEADSTGMFNRFAAISLVVPGTYVPPGIHRYWRIRFTENYVNPIYTALAEIQFRQAKGTPEAVVGTVWSSGAYGGDAGSWGSPKAIDGNNSTYWYGQQDGAGEWWLACDFGAGNERSISEVWIKSSIDGSYGTQAPAHLYLEHSDDGVAWTTAFFEDDIPAWASGDERAFSA